MSTPAQILANRENAQLSTGPLTEEGKSKSSMNALRHGLSSRGLIILPGQESAFEQLEQGLQASLRPNGELQKTLFKRILECAWNLHRCRLAEAQLYQVESESGNENIDPLLDDRNEAKYARIQKYARQSESSMLKVIRELGRLQTEAQYRHEAHPLTEEQISDPEEFQASVHNLSEVCSVQKITTVLAQTGNLHNEAKSRGTNLTQNEAMELLKAYCAPPVLRAA